MITATLTSKGQLTVPKEIRDRFHLKAGQRIEFRITDDGQLLLKPRHQSLLALQGILKVKPGQHITIEEMNEAITEGWGSRWRRFTKGRE